MNHQELDDFVTAMRRVGVALIALLDERDQLKAELAAIDSVLGNRSALDDEPTRLAKIQHAINTAKRAPPRTSP